MQCPIDSEVLHKITYEGGTGTSPNIIYENEHPGTFELDGKFFRRFEPSWNGGSPQLEPSSDSAAPKVSKPAPFTSYEHNGRYISFFGDNHPVYAGNVVKAMASAQPAADLDKHPDLEQRHAEQGQ